MIPGAYHLSPEQISGLIQRAQKRIENIDKGLAVEHFAPEGDLRNQILKNRRNLELDIKKYESWL